MTPSAVQSVPRTPPRRRVTRIIVVTVLAALSFAVPGIGLMLGGRGATGSAPDGSAPPVSGAGSPESTGADALSGSIARYQQRLTTNPKNDTAWAELGAAYVQQARVSVDPAYYPKAEGALRRSLRLNPTDNVAAMVGMAALANARHEFAEAVRWAEKARAVNPYHAGTYGVLDDAYTQLGNYPAALRAAQRMLDLRPGVASFTRASYEMEERGRDAAAKRLLEQALAAAFTPADVAFCRYYLGELAFHSGNLSEAARQYRLGMTADPSYAPLLEGMAKTEALQGNTDAAVRDFRTLVERVPAPQYVIEFGELLVSLGRRTEAGQQWALLASEQRLFAPNGVVDDLTWAEFEADHGSATKAVRHARAEWSRRQSVLVADALGWALHKAGRHAEGLTYARKATRLGWRNALFFYHRAEIERALGNGAAARRDLALARQINPRLSARMPALARRS